LPILIESLERERERERERGREREKYKNLKQGVEDDLILEDWQCPCQNRWCIVKLIMVKTTDLHT
jgi:hypothetical protein